MKRGYSFMVFSHPEGKSRKFFLSRPIVLLGAAFVVLLLAGFAAMFFLFASHLRMSARIGRLQGENQRLTSENAKINELSARMVELESVRRRLSQILGVDYVYEDTTAQAPKVEESRPVSVSEEPTADEDRFRPEGKPVEGIISRGYSENHPGLDLAARTDAPVTCTADGIVLDADYDDVFGNYVLVDHSGEFRTFYGHLSRSTVQKGQGVVRGDTLGFVGNTGRSTGPHLHYEVRRGDDRLNPVLFLF
jgi:murein DD-endopeptidase MepM/ murein hydrolase activator NlpD